MDLDLGSTPTVAKPTADAPFVLEAPKAAPEVTPQQAVNQLAIPDEAKSEIDRKAEAFAESLAKLDPKSPDFAAGIKQIDSLGASEIAATASMTNRMLERPSATAGKNSPQGKVGRDLLELRNVITDLDPKRADMGGIKKVLKWLPGGDKVDNYFARYSSAQSQLDDIVTSLQSGQSELRQDNGAIESEQVSMWGTLGKLAEYNRLAQALDEAVQDKIADLKTAGEADAAKAMEADVLFAVRQRHQDIMTQMAVATQGYLALGLVHKNNSELIRGVDRAQTTTLAALRTAVIVSQALGQQKLVLDQVTALNSTTSDMIVSTSEMLQQQGTEIQKQAASSTVDVEKLQQAFNNVFATMDEIDRFRMEANASMAQTVTVLQNQVVKAKPYLDRAKKGQEIEAGRASGSGPIGSIGG